MVEDVSSVYDDVQIREWASNIRQIKIAELSKMILDNEKKLHSIDKKKIDYLTLALTNLNLKIKLSVLRKK